MTDNPAFFSPEMRCFPVTLGELTFVAERYQLTAQRIFSEQSSVDGNMLFTNTAQRSRRIVLEGFWVTDSDPSTLLLTLDACLAENTSFPLTLRQMFFADCRIVKYTAEESGCDPIMKCRLELIAPEVPKEADIE